MAGTTLRHKRGDTFQYDCVVQESKKGPPLDLTGWTIRSQLRDLRDHLICEFCITIVNAVEGRYRLSAGDTSDWVPGAAAMDIEYRDAGGVVRSTETMAVTVLKDETHD